MRVLDCERPNANTQLETIIEFADVVCERVRHTVLACRFCWRRPLAILVRQSARRRIDIKANGHHFYFSC